MADHIAEYRATRDRVAAVLPDAVVSLTTGRVVVHVDGVTGSWFPGTGLPALATTADGRIVDCVAMAGDEPGDFGDIIAEVVTHRQRQRRS